ncbi:S1-like domain-containing RNA-binding protein [Hathewaya histolytica]|uniref:CvfB family protein n=1 Tax=Hathewaya histolytica TaxID=1498 RepID=UPI0039EA0DE7
MIKVGEFNNLVVKKKRDFGYFLVEDIDIVKSEEILLPFSSVEGKEFEVEDQIEVFIYKDSKDRTIATCKKPLAQVGDIAHLKVVDQTKIGCFIDFGLERDILVPFKEMAYELSVGESYLFYIYLDKTGRISATTYIDKYLHNTNHFEIGEELMATSYGEQTNGSVMVAIQNLYRAVVLKKENFTGIRPGEIVSVRVKRYYEDGKIEVTPRKKRLDEKNDLEGAIILYLKLHDGHMKFNDNSSPEQIKSTFRCSKNAFKRALGGLMKKGMVSQDKEGTHLERENPIKEKKESKPNYIKKDNRKNSNKNDKKPSKKENNENKFFNKFVEK